MSQLSRRRLDKARLELMLLEGRDVPSGLAPTPWPMYGMNAQHTGDSPYTGPQNGTVAFNTDGDIIGASGLISSGASLGFDGSLQSANPNGGYFPAVADDGTIYTASDSGVLYAVNPTQPGATVDEQFGLTGGIKWTITLGRSQYAPTIGTDGTIYVSALDSYLYAINPNGTLKWKFKATQEFESAPALSADGLVVYAGSDDNNLYAVNTANGTLKWKYKASDDVNAAPAIDAAGNLYITTSNWFGWSINKNGKLNWKVPINDSHGSTWSWADGGAAIDESTQTVYFGGSDGLYAYTFGGAFKWKHASDKVWTHPAVAADGMVYYTTTAGMLYAVQANGVQKWSAPGGGNPFLGSDGTLYSGGRAYRDDGVYRPTIEWLEDTPDPVAPGGSILLRARDLSDNGSIAAVNYYRDANGNNQLDVGIDESVGSNTNGSNYWGIEIAAPVTPGTYNYFAQAIDNEDLLSNVVKKTNTVANPLTAAGGAALTSASGPALTTRDVQPLLQEALRRWGLSGADVRGLGKIDIRIADLGGPTLGLASGRTITLDANAAGHGWFIDRTPRSDSEFRRPGDQGEQGKIDLLTVVEHELGHILGRDHGDNGVMSETLAAGTRESLVPENHGRPAAKRAPVGKAGWFLSSRHR
jgi:outer membrane protein assembly factor BamB